MSVILHGIKARVARGQASSAEAQFYANLTDSVAELALSIAQQSTATKAKL
jgi:hypothetical protein